MSDYETLLGLVERYSPSGEERKAVEWLVKRMHSLGFDETFVDGAGNAVGLKGDGPKQVVLLGHIDTVPGEIKVEQIGNLLYGRGSVDAKGPLACFVDAVARTDAADGWQFVVIGAVDEERDSLGARFVAEQHRPEYALIGEPNSWDRVAIGYKGSAWVDVKVERGQTHSASGEPTAAERAVGIWLAVQEFTEEYNQDRERAFDKILPILRGMQTGEGDFEQWASLRLGVRLPLDLKPEDWYARLGELPREDRFQSSCRVTLEKVGYPVQAWECEKNSPVVRAFLNGIRQEGGRPRFVYKTGTADLNIVAPAWKCPAAVYGPGDSALDHRPDEHISLEEYQKGVRVLVHALQALVERKSA
jgi:LysW-gamma-L-lysine carboxypeptidase